MATYALLIDIAYLKDSGYIDENVDDKLLGRIIFTAQEENLQPILGSALYDEITAQKIAGTLTALNTTLITNKYFKRGLLFSCLYEGMDSFNYKIRNKGVMQTNSDNSTSVDLSVLTRLGATYQNRAEWNFEQLRLYLVENEASYPLYYNPGSATNIIHPKRDTYFSGWVMGSEDDCDSKFWRDRNIDL